MGLPNVVTNSEQSYLPCCSKAEGCENLRNTLGQSSTARKKTPRGGTRIPCQIPIVLASLDPLDPFSQPCCVILANLGGCAVRSPRPATPGTVVHLNGLPGKKELAARVINCISLGQYENLWLLGLALAEPGNVWGIETVPPDWNQ